MQAVPKVPNDDVVRESRYISLALPITNYLGQESDHITDGLIVRGDTNMNYP